MPAAPIASAASSASAIAAPRPASSRYTTGATSSAPTRGCMPAWRGEVDAVRGGRGAGRERAVELARARPRGRRPRGGGRGRRSGAGRGHGAAKAAPIASSTASSRPSETFGTATSVMAPARTRRRRARGCRRRRASRPRSGSRGGRGPTTVPPMPALAPKATWTVPSIFSSSRMLPVRRARSFVPTPSSARLRPCSPGGVHQRGPARAPLAGGVREPAVADRELDRCVGQPEARERRGVHRALAAERRDEALAAGQVAERAGRGEVAVVGDPRAAA